MSGQKTISCTYSEDCFRSPRLIRESFNSYNDGPLNGQGSWGTDTDFLVQGLVVQEGAKAIKVINTGVNDIAKSCPLSYSGCLSGYLRKDVSQGSPSTMQTLYVTDAGDHPLVECGMRSTYIGYYSAGIWFPLIANYSLSQWYKLEMEWRSVPNERARYRIDDGYCTSWVPFCAVNMHLPVAKVKLEMWSLSSGGIAYFDNLR